MSAHKTTRAWNDNSKRHAFNFFVVAYLYRAIRIYAISPILLKPLSEPKLRAKPWLLLRILMKPVTGPFSPSFSTLKLAKASSPVILLATVHSRRLHDFRRAENLPNTDRAYKFALKN
jgi:hypothetical protein